MTDLTNYHDALDMVDSVGRQLATLADAFDTVHQHSLAGQLTGMAADLYQAKEAISKAFGGDCDNEREPTGMDEG